MTRQETQADIDVILPAGAPQLTPAGAVGLLRLLLDGHDNPETTDEDARAGVA